MSRFTNSRTTISFGDGDDLHCTISVPMVDAALGTTVTVDAILDGLTEITIPAGTQPSSVTTRRGHGMPHLRFWCARRPACARRGGGAGSARPERRRTAAGIQEPPRP